MAAWFQRLSGLQLLPRVENGADVGSYGTGGLYRCTCDLVHPEKSLLVRLGTQLQAPSNSIPPSVQQASGFPSRNDGVRQRAPVNDKPHAARATRARRRPARLLAWGGRPLKMLQGRQQCRLQRVRHCTCGGRRGDPSPASRAGSSIGMVPRVRAACHREGC